MHYETNHLLFSCFYVKFSWFFWKNFKKFHKKVGNSDILMKISHDSTIRKAAERSIYVMFLEFLKISWCAKLHCSNLCWLKDLLYTFMSMAFQKCVLYCNILFVRCKTCDIDDYLNIAPDTNWYWPNNIISLWIYKQ